jgi:hypothetical protein
MHYRHCLIEIHLGMSHTIVHGHHSGLHHAALSLHKIHGLRWYHHTNRLVHKLAAHHISLHELAAHHIVLGAHWIHELLVLIHTGYSI